MPEGAANTPSERWLRERHGDEIVTTASNPRLAFDLALAGVARIVLPACAAAHYPQLRRVGPSIEVLAHDEWLVCHHEARHDSPTREAIEGIGRLLSDRDLRAAAR
ncbi:hypothetical protein DEA8626_00190 [Defluviimonas aquaemixtae]|uniref:LysR substrate-binding domain-containing protein n=1 Tax=Albidovulum aquaemixtae TaxID=1542388 RepID=A0A2R8B224_9RHOB|nr:hypothetical protein [Defluviimonas aquaemixtae]SPH16679.1 hypothetical protein DEA8626_00190 [Defluviimonas aquaemixtae]